MKNEVKNQLPSTASEEEKERFVREEQAKGYRVACSTEGGCISWEE